MMTDQKIFETVARHLVTQGGRSVAPDPKNGGDMCQYHGADGSKCAVGVLIADDEYTPDMEERDVQELGKRGLLPEHLVEYIELLDTLQHVHDCTDDGPHFRREIVRELRIVADLYMLDATILDTLVAV